MNIPARYLRKPWFIILNHLASKPEKYRVYFNDEVKSKVPVDLISSHSISAYDADLFEFDDPIEKSWFEVGIEGGGKITPVCYLSSYRISKTYIAFLCKAINLSADIGGTNKLNYARPVEGVIDVSLEKGDLTQIVLHKGLSDFRTSGDKIRFGDTSLQIGKASAERLIDYAIKIVPDLYTDKAFLRRETAILEALKSELKKFKVAKPVIPDLFETQSFAIEHHAALWQNPITGSLEHTYWVCMERTDALRSKGLADYGIAISTIVFQDTSSGFLTCEMQSMFFDQKGIPHFSTFAGIAAVESKKESLHIELHNFNKEHVTPGMATFTLSLNDIANQNIIVGHHSYYAPTFHKYITKTVVWMRYEEPDFPIRPSKPFSLHTNPGEFCTAFTKDLNPFDDKYLFEEIPLEIRQFLANRALNRLTMPKKRIRLLKGEHNSLESWMKNQYRDVYKDDILRICCIDYVVCFYYGEENISQITDKQILAKIRIDELSLVHHSDSGMFKAKYAHRPSKNVPPYTGEVHRKSYSVEVMMSNTKEQTGHTTEKNFVFLSFCIPEKLENAFKEGFDACDHFTGIISGLNDDKATPISFSALLFKRADVPQRMNKKFKDKLIKFFRMDQTLCIRPLPLGTKL
jgi:hypothetical protein